MVAGDVWEWSSVHDLYLHHHMDVYLLIKSLLQNQLCLLLYFLAEYFPSRVIINGKTRAVQWLRLCASTVSGSGLVQVGVGLIPG